MTKRLPTHLIIGALLRRANDSGGMAVVRARGDAEAGAILLVLERETKIVERNIGPDGRDSFVLAKPRVDESVDHYWQRRRSRDPDLWVVALDIPDAERFAAETILQD